MEQAMRLGQSVVVRDCGIAKPAFITQRIARAYHALAKRRRISGAVHNEVGIVQNRFHQGKMVSRLADGKGEQLLQTNAPLSESRYNPEIPPITLLTRAGKGPESQKMNLTGKQFMPERVNVKKKQIRLCFN